MYYNLLSNDPLAKKNSAINSEQREYRNDGIRKIAIVDFGVHHGNGTEEIIRQLVPTVEKTVIRTPFAVGELGAPRYRPWLDETDVHNIFFASTHGYGPRGLEFAEPPPREVGSTRHLAKRIRQTPSRTLPWSNHRI